MGRLVEFALANHLNGPEPIYLNPATVVSVQRRVIQTTDLTTGKTTREPSDDQTVIHLKRPLCPGSDPQVIVYGSVSEVAAALNQGAADSKE